MNIKKERSNIDFTDGTNLIRKMIKFTLPIILTSFLSLFFTTADLLTVNYFGGGASSMGAIGANSYIINLLINFFLGFGTGANIVIGNYKGMNNKDKAQKAMYSSILIALIFGILISITGIFIARPILIAIQTDTAILDKAEQYLKIYLLSAPFMLVFQFGSAILRSIGDSRRPLYALGFSGIFNIGVNLLFVALFHLDVLGVALSTLISNIIASIAVIYFLKNNNSNFLKFNFKELRIYKNETFEVLKNGFAAAIQTLAFNITNIVIQSGINSFGEYATEGCTISENVIGYQYLCINSISTASLAAISQNNGSRNKENIKKLLFISLALEFIIVMLVGLLFYLLKGPIINCLVNKNDPGYEEIYKYASVRITIIALSYFLCGFMEVFSCYFKGLKFPLTSAVISLIGSCAIRLIFLYTIFKLDYFHNIYWLTFIWPVSWIVTTIIYLIFIRKISKIAFSNYNKENN